MVSKFPHPTVQNHQGINSTELRFICCCTSHFTCCVFKADFVRLPECYCRSSLSRIAGAMANPALTEDAVNAGAVAWVLTSTAFVFLMTAGLGFFYGGLVRDTNIINTMMMSVVSMGIVTLTWVVFGFSWAFGENCPFIGNFDYSLWMDLDMKMWGDSGLPALVFAAFQLTFAIIASAIISGIFSRTHAFQCLLHHAGSLVIADLCPSLPLGLGPWRLDWRDGSFGLCRWNRGSHQLRCVWSRRWWNSGTT